MEKPPLQISTVAHTFLREKGGNMYDLSEKMYDLTRFVDRSDFHFSNKQVLRYWYVALLLPYTYGARNILNKVGHHFLVLQN